MMTATLEERGRVTERAGSSCSSQAGASLPFNETTALTRNRERLLGSVFSWTPQAAPTARALAALRQFRGLRCAVAPADGMGAAVSRDGVAGDVAPLVVPAVLRPGCAEEAGQLVDTPGLPHRLRRDAVPLRVSLTLLPG